MSQKNYFKFYFCFRFRLLRGACTSVTAYVHQYNFRSLELEFSTSCPIYDIYKYIYKHEFKYV